MESLRSRDRDRERDARDWDRDRDRDRERDRDRDRDRDRERELHEGGGVGVGVGGGAGGGGAGPGPTIKGRDWDTRDYTDSRREWDGRGRLVHPDVPDKELVMDMMDEKMVPDALCVGVKLEEGLLKKVLEPESALGKRSREPDDNEKPELKKLCVEEVTAPLEEALSDISDDDADGILNREDSVDDLGSMEIELESCVSQGKEVPPNASCMYPLCVPTAPHPQTPGLSAEDLPETPGQSLSLLPPATAGGMSAASNRTPMRDVEPERDTREGGPGTVGQDASREPPEPRSMLGSGMEDRPPDEETMDNLDFEEISDEELDPEESKAGIGDALGVDWASLVAESRPRTKPEAKPGSARRRWESHRVLMRLGMSFRFTGTEVAETIVSKIKEMNAEAEKKKEGPEEGEDVSSNPDESVDTNFLHPVASIHVNLREKAAKRRALFASAGPYKRALSARRDLAIRRQLCNLPVKETLNDIQPNPDQDLYRLSVQLFERSL